MSEQEQFEQEQQNRQPEQTEQTLQLDTVEQDGQEQQLDNGVYATPDVYQSQTAQEIYQTPDTNIGHHDTGGVFSGDRTENDPYGNNMYGNGQPDYNVYGGSQPGGDQPGSDPYVKSWTENSVYGNNQFNGQYGNGQTENSAYGNNQFNGQYGNGQPENNVYGNSQSGNDQYGYSQFENDQSGNSIYGENQHGNDPYGNNTYGKNRYANDQPGNNVYGKKQYSGNQYGNNPYGNPYGNPYNPDSYGYNPYSPYAVPAQKKNTGLIIGIIVGIAVLFLIAVFALFYHAIAVLYAKNDEQKNDAKIEEFYQDHFSDDFHDDKNYKDDDRDDFYDHNDYDDHDYDRDYDDDEYYTLHDDIRDLSYSIDWENYDYDANGDNVIITVEYPVVRGGNIPNRDKINNAFEEEAAFFIDYYEDEYSKYMNDDDSYFYVSATGYVTYMSEDVLSVVFSEYVYSDYFDSVSLYCINIDVQNGVILDNTDILSVDDDFSIDFRYRSERQNGTIDELDWFSDQEITQMLTSSSSLIIFYTPQGLEVGLNYDEGYVTVTYHDYKDYLNTF